MTAPEPTEIAKAGKGRVIPSSIGPPPEPKDRAAIPTKLYPFSVEVDGEVHDFIDKLAAIQFRNSCRADGKTANLL